MSKLITASLVSAVSWFKTCPDSWKKKAYTDLSNQLSRIYPDEMPEAIKRGIDFENQVQKIVESDRIESCVASNEFKTICRLCKGGKFQVKSKSIMNINGVDYCLYGKIDVLHEALIIDIKTTGSFKGGSNYLKTIQHEIYCWNENIPNFMYLVAEFDQNKIKEVHKVLYAALTRRELQESIAIKIQNTIQFLKSDLDLWELYTTKFNQF